MRFGSIFFWLALVGVLVVSSMAYQRYMIGGRGPGRSHSTNAMGSLKQNVQKMRSKYDSVLGADGGGRKKKAKMSRRDQIRESNRRLLESNK